MLIENGAGRYGGVIYAVRGSTASWNGRKKFIRTARLFGAEPWQSSISWGGGATFTNNSALYGGALFVIKFSAASWNGSTTFLANQAWYSGGVAYVQTVSSISWAGHAESVFDGNQALFGRGMAVANNSKLSCAEGDHHHICRKLRNYFRGCPRDGLWVQATLSSTGTALLETQEYLREASAAHWRLSVPSCLPPLSSVVRRLSCAVSRRRWEGDWSPATRRRSGAGTRRSWKILPIGLEGPSSL